MGTVITWRHILESSGAIGSGKAYGLYFIMGRLGEVLYVGRSRDPIDRLLGHMGRGTWWFSGPSSVGEFIAFHLPGSLGWPIKLWTYGDCKRGYRRSVGNCDAWADDAEARMIDKYRPYFNGAGNPNPRGLLAGYEAWKSDRDEGMRRAVRLAFGEGLLHVPYTRRRGA